MNAMDARLDALEKEHAELKKRLDAIEVSAQHSL